MSEATNFKDLIEYPVHYGPGQKVYDDAGHPIADIRGWGRLQYLPDPEKKQDDIGQFVADAINEKLSRMNYERPKTT